MVWVIRVNRARISNRLLLVLLLVLSCSSVNAANTTTDNAADVPPSYSGLSQDDRDMYNFLLEKLDVESASSEGSAADGKGGDNKDSTSSYTELAVDEPDIDSLRPVAILRVVDKVMAKTSYVRADVKKTVKVGGLSVYVNACWVSSVDPEDSRALVVVRDDYILKDRPLSQDIGKILFSGWMVSKYPFIHNVPDAMYDVYLSECVASVK